MAYQNPNPQSDRTAWRAGVDLALELLGEAGDVGLDEAALESDCRNGRPQNNVVLRHLVKLRGLDDPRADAAFCAVLSDFIAQYAKRGDVSMFRRMARRPIATTAGVPHG